MELVEELPIARAIPVAVRIAEPIPVAYLVPRRGFFGSIAAGVEWLFGVAVLLVALATLAAVPVAQFLSLGYMLEAGGRVARTGRFRDGFIGVRKAARLGGIVFGAWLFLLPVRFVADMASAADIIDPGSETAASWRAGLFALIGITFLHVLLAVANGGRLRTFLWPFNFVSVLRRVWRGGAYSQARDAVWETVVALRLPYYFLLGLKGFLCGLAWLAIPVTLLAIGQNPAPVAGVVGFLGAMLLALVLLYLPFLQMRLAAENRLRAGFQWLEVRREFRRAPVAFLFAFLVAILFALPLYLLKIEVVPREAAWLPGLLFIGFIFPARLLAGWALARARKREQSRHWFFRWAVRPLLLVVALFYVLMVFFAQYTSWNGVGGLYEQHAFLLPVPLVGG